MLNIRNLIVGICLCSAPQLFSGHPVTLVNALGESLAFEVNDDETFASVMNQIETFFQQESMPENFNNESEGCHLSLAINQEHITVQSKSKRNFNKTVEEDQRKDIAYIITTLGNENLLTIGTETPSLKKAGKRIRPLHPFRFLATVFTSEKLKAGIHAIRDRGGWVWSGFIDELVDSLNEENEHKNLLNFTEKFANMVKIDVALIAPSLEQGRWKDFVNILIDKIPRKNNPNEYDM